MTFRVLNLAPGETVPSGFEDYLTPAEIAHANKLTSSGRAAGFPIRAGEPVRTNRVFTSWSLFLISNPTWLTDASDRVAALYDSYLGYARAIGGHHAAVWFGRAPTADGAAKPSARDIDTDRCADVAAKLGLDVAKGPHVVVLTTHPSATEALKDYVVLELNGLGVAATQALLTLLASQLVSAKLDQAALASKAWWLSWREAVANAYAVLDKHVLSRLKVTANEKGVAVSLEPPKP